MTIIALLYVNEIKKNNRHIQVILNLIFRSV